MARAEQIKGWFEQACRLHAGGQWAEAQALYRQILASNPRHVDARYLLGASLSQVGRHEEAIVVLREVLAIRPHYVDAHASLGEALLALNRVDEAIAAFEQSLLLKPDQAGPFVNLGSAWHRKGDNEKALACFAKAIKIKPQSADAHFNLGNLLRDAGQIESAIACYQRAIELRPDFAEAWSNLGYSYKHSGRLDEAVRAFRRALQFKPDHAAIQSGLAFLVQFQPGQDAAAIYREQLEWAKRHAEPLAAQIQPHANDRTSGRRLRIGYVSPDFRNHCQSFFTLPLLSHHDHEQFEVFCYADVAQPDGITQRVRDCSDVWRNAVGCSDAQIADMIRVDQIDILVDLTMQMACNRLMVFARKPAPVQVTWLAYPGTTGLSAMDYRLSDGYLDPPGLFDASYAERTIHLPDAFWCYDPLTSAPGVNALPALSSDHITFGCLNNFCKVNESVLQLWGKVLNAVPNSRMMILCVPGAPRRNTLDQFQRAGVAAENIEFVDAALRPEYLAYYQRIDMALDTFPYNGHTTSLDAFWMGVPVVTLVGSTVVGRAGLCQLMNLGMPELIAQTEQDYVRIAAELATDLPRLVKLRGELRGRMEGSALMNAARFARHIEAAYREMWGRWCGEK